MKCIPVSIILLIGLLTYNTELSEAQYEKVELTTTHFGSRVSTPIEMDVKNSDDKVVFSANNKSYFPYEFKIKFNEFKNLSPYMNEKTFLLFPGYNRLFTLTIVDKTQSPDFSFSMNYKIAASLREIDTSFPYLIPVQEGKKVKFGITVNPDDTIYYENQFVLSPNDSIFAARKGWITALPDNKTEMDRISAYASLEIRHSDGTVAVYRGLDPNSITLKPGKIVYPGQYIGRLNNYDRLYFHVYQFQDNGSVESLEIKYSGMDETVVSAKNLFNHPASHPSVVVRKEMSKKEISNYNKGKLF